MSKNEHNSYVITDASLPRCLTEGDVPLRRVQPHTSNSHSSGRVKLGELRVCSAFGTRHTHTPHDFLAWRPATADGQRHDVVDAERAEPIDAET